MNTWTSVVVDEFLNLGFALSSSRLVDGHFDDLVVVGHDNRSKRGEFGVDHGIIDRPESVEIEGVLIPISSRGHLLIGLVSNNVIDEVVRDAR